MSQPPTNMDSDNVEILEWDRIHSFLNASSAPLAIIETDSPEQSEVVLTAIGDVVGRERLHVFRGHADEDFRRPLDWLEEQTDEGGVYVFADLRPYTENEQAGQDFWTWANAQRERWPRDDSIVLFLLQPEQVDNLCRHAPMLWDWIPLKFNLIGREGAEHRLPDAQLPFAAAMHQVAGTQNPNDQERLKSLRAARLNSLRDQLLRARQKGLPEHLVRRYYAWPLFRELVQAGNLDSARQVMTSDLGYQFPTELPYLQAAKARELLKGVWRASDARRAQDAETAIASYIARRGLRVLRPIVSCVLHMLYASVAQEYSDYESAEGWIHRMRDIADRLGSDLLTAQSYDKLGYLATLRHDYAEAESWYRRALGAYEKLGDGKQAAAMLGKLAAIEYAQKASLLDQETASSDIIEQATAPNAPRSRIKRLARSALKAVARRIERRAYYKHLRNNC